MEFRTPRRATFAAFLLSAVLRWGVRGDTNHANRPRRGRPRSRRTVAAGRQGAWAWAPWACAPRGRRGGHGQIRTRPYVRIGRMDTLAHPLWRGQLSSSFDPLRTFNLAGRTDCRMRALVVPISISTALLATPASACLEIVTPKSEARAFNEADVVVRVQTLTEDYLAVPDTPSLRVGVATGQVIEVLKGRAATGDVITYRVVDGEGRAPTCPARRFTRPGGSYKLYLKQTADWGPPTILIPTD